MASLRRMRVYALRSVNLRNTFIGFSGPKPARKTCEVVGCSDLLGER